MENSPLIHRLTHGTKTLWITRNLSTRFSTFHQQPYTNKLERKIELFTLSTVPTIMTRGRLMKKIYLLILPLLLASLACLETKTPTPAVTQTRTAAAIALPTTGEENPAGEVFEIQDPIPIQTPTATKKVRTNDTRRANPTSQRSRLHEHHVRRH